MEKIVNIVPSKINRSKSTINFDIINNVKGIRECEKYTEKENLIDGVFKMKIVRLKKESEIKILDNGLKLIIDYVFEFFPVHKIQFILYESDTEILNILNKNEFVQEACLKEDTFINGKYENKYILSKFRS